MALVRILIDLGQSVLLTSYTHSAVDNILLKMIEVSQIYFLINFNTINNYNYVNVILSLFFTDCYLFKN